MIFDNGISAEGDLTKEDEKRLVTWRLLIEKVELVKMDHFEYMMIKSPFLW